MQIKPERVNVIDTAKAIGIFLVFYGHLVERFAVLGSEAAFIQYKFIYSFHMPFFFIIAGFFFRRKNVSKSDETRILFYKRIVPVLFFAVITIPIWLLYNYLIWGSIDFSIITEKTLPYLKGHPELNQITWFLICLFIVEIIALFVLPKIKSRMVGLFVAGMFLSLGLYLTNDINQTKLLFGIYKNTWFIHEALVAFGLYALGYFTFDSLRYLLQQNIFARILLLVSFLGITFLTFDLNSPYETFVVLMKESWHGYSLWFIITAVSGTLALIFISSIIPYNKLINFVGKNTLILLGMNGIFHTFVNLHICTKVNNLDSFWVITAVSFSVSILSILLSVPAILIFNKYIPQLVGNPTQSGPLLPNLIKK